MATLQEKLREQSKNNWADFDQSQAKFKQHITEFLKQGSKKLLVFKMPNVSLEMWRMRQVLNELMGRYEKTNQIFVKWDQLIGIMGPLQILPKLPNLLVLEFDKPITENDRHVLCKLLERLSMSVWKKTVVFSNEKLCVNIFPQRVNLDISFVNLNNFNIETTSKQLIKAAALGHLNEVIELINIGVDINQTDEKKNTALHLAVAAGHTEVVLELIEHGAKHLGNSECNTPLHLAAREGHNNVLTALLENKHDRSSRTVLNLDEVNRDKQTALHLAAEGGHRDAVLTLWRHGAQFLPHSYYDTPLHLAVNKGHNDVVTVFLENDVDVNIKGNCRYMPLHYAAWKGHVDVLLTLIEYGAKLDSITNGNWSALHLAITNDHFEIVQTLLERDISTNSTLLSMKGPSGETPLELARRLGHKMIVDYLTNRKA